MYSQKLRCLRSYTLTYSTASSAKSPDALFSSLASSGLPDTREAHTFIAQVYSRVPRKSKSSKNSGDSNARKAEKEAKALRSQKFGFLMDDESGPSETALVKKERKRKDDVSISKEKKDRHVRKRDYDGKDWESDEEDQVRKRMRAEEESERYDDLADMALNIPEDENARKERERQRDIEERDAFAERVRDRDKDKTKQLAEDRSAKSAGAVDAAKRRQIGEDVELSGRALPSLREHSRQEYLTKRELQQIELLRKEIQDDENLFRGMKISKRERAELDHKKQLLRLVEERLKIDDKYDGYQLPEDYLTEQGKIDKKKKHSALYQRYEEAKPKDDQFVTDVDQWEESQTLHSTFRTGAMDKPEIVDNYDYVFDESQTIQFVMDMESKIEGEGNMSAADKLLQAQIDEAEKRGTKQFQTNWLALLIILCSQDNGRNTTITANFQMA